MAHVGRKKKNRFDINLNEAGADGTREEIYETIDETKIMEKSLSNSFTIMTIVLVERLG